MWTYAKDSLKIAIDVINFNTEIYQFDIDVRGKPGVAVFQELRGASAQNGVRQSFSWIKTLKGGGKMMYTSMGHETPEWTANNSWLTKATYAYMKYVDIKQPGIKTNGSSLEITTAKNHDVKIRDVHGRLVASGKGKTLSEFHLKEGVYFVTATSPGAVLSKRVFIR
jgi:hypothetical protein